MAAPESKTIRNLNGKWVWNKTLSDDANDALALQGTSVITRTAIRWATVTIEMRQYVESVLSPNGGETQVTFLEIAQTASGLKGSKHTRRIDGQRAEQSNWLFGTLVASMDWGTVEDINDEFLREGWLEEDEGANLIIIASENKDRGWSSTQVNGFQMINGERHYCGRSVTERKGKKVSTRVVFDYLP